MIFQLIVALFFGFIQAIVGWWMVKSGLYENPYVSQYRLSFHLINAIIILSILLWMTLNQLYDFIRFNNYLNISARSLLSAIRYKL